MIETGVIHGRFQVFHNDHLKYVLAGKEHCKHLIIGITNPDPSKIQREASDLARGSLMSNPLTYFERYQMVRNVLNEAGLDYEGFSVVPFPISQPDLYRYYLPVAEATFFLTIYDDWGRAKLARFRDLKLRTSVLWEVPLERKGITASEVRRRMFSGNEWKHLVPRATATLMDRWGIDNRLRRLAEESGADASAG